MLLSGTPENTALYGYDALKAAVIAASMGQDTFKNTVLFLSISFSFCGADQLWCVETKKTPHKQVKMIATNLIANGAVDEGVQLLCIIGRALDACRYLQTYERWMDAAWLAKARKIPLSFPPFLCFV
jgi:hypothetical protein